MENREGAVSARAGYSREEGLVVLRLSEDDYLKMLFMLGVATGACPSESLPGNLAFINRLNAGNDHFVPYAVSNEPVV